MDDSCAVCAENLEWVAYGECGHKEVCSTCVARLRFICDDRRCCICKSTNDVVFVTKAMGDYTKMIGDFSSLGSQSQSQSQSQRKEGKMGPYWYHEDTQSFFDDIQQYNFIKATCRLSCSVCDSNDRHPRFRSIGQLKGHLSHEHKLSMCDLCLEGRKVFICEQKLYTRSQLNQHKRTGDSLVDGTESERGGFAGHPFCEYCRTSFYGENELFNHMSRDHFSCHVCRRQFPDNFEYFKDYDDLESHFRHKHHLCEDEECLRKKFTVFQTAEDLKRHNALEHGGRMSRSKRNAVLQIPTSFRYQSSNNESGYHRGRRRFFRRDSSPDGDRGMSVQDILDSVSSSVALPDSSSTSASVEPNIVQSFESLNTSEPESSARYRQAVSQISIAGPLVESSFPPLSSAPSSSQQKLQPKSKNIIAGSSFPPLTSSPSSSQQKSQPKSKNTMAARLQRQSRATVLNVAQPKTASSGLWPTTPVPVPRPTAPITAPRHTVPSPATLSVQAFPAPEPAPATSAPWLSLATPSGQMNVATVSSESSSYASSLRSVDEHDSGSWASRNPRSSSSSSRLNHSSSAPNLTGSRSFDPVTDFPPVSAAQPNKVHSNGKNKTENVQTANKTLVERMRAALDNDEDKFNLFKGISQEYRQGSIGTWEYLDYVNQFDLTHLVPDLARLLPDVRKQKELLDAYSATEQSNGSWDTLWDAGNARKKESSSSKDKGKKVMVSGSSRLQETLADSVISTVRTLQSQSKPTEEVEVLEKDGYRANRGKSIMAVGNDQQPPSQSARSHNGGISVDKAGAKNQKKKSSKFHRLRLGDDSPAATLDVWNTTSNATSVEMDAASSNGPSSRRVWGGGASQKLFTKG